MNALLRQGAAVLRAVLAVALGAAPIFAGCDGAELKSESGAALDASGLSDAGASDVVGADAARADAPVDGDPNPADAGDGGMPGDTDDTPPGEIVQFSASEGFLARQAEFLAFCTDGNEPGSGSIYGQSCRVANGPLPLDSEEIAAAVSRLDERLDTADFRANGLVRLLYLDRATGGLGAQHRDEITRAMLEFKYWLDEPGDDGMAYWTENHQVLFHTAELLIGQLHPDTAFPNSGLTGAEHVAHALPRLHRWLDLRGRYGFSEWHSNVYFNEDIPALLNLVDFAEDDALRDKAAMVLDVIALDLLHNTFDGALATTHGRTYQSKFLNGANDSTREFAWIALGLGDYRSAGNFGAAFLATSSYYPPPLLEELAAAIEPRSELRQRDSWNTDEGDAVGVGYDGVDEVVIWAGLSAIVAPEIIDGAMDVMDEYDLWDGFLFGSLPDEVLGLLRSLIGTPGLRGLAEELRPLSQGMALEAVDTYVYRTPDFQLAGAQDYKPGLWSAQTLMWRGALSDRAFVLTTAPGLIGVGDVDDVTIDDPWIGGWHPRVTLHRNVGVIQYREIETAALLDQFVQGDWSHVYWPANEFDEAVERDGWVFGRLGDGYVGLWSEHPMLPVEDVPYELRLETRTNVFVVEMGSAEQSGSFEEFVDALVESSPTLESGVVHFDSPSLGEVRVGWEGPMRVDESEVDIGPHERWDHPNTRQTRHSPLLEATLGDRVMRWDFAAGRRTLYEIGD